MTTMALDTTDPRADYPEDQQWVNQGPDRRLGGALGKRLALEQRLRSFRETIPPRRELERLDDGTLIEVATAPNGKVHTSIARPTRNGRWNTERYGYRWDPNWGDERTKGYNPRPDLPPGGYIWDVVIKWNQKVPHIEVH